MSREERKPKTEDNVDDRITPLQFVSLQLRYRAMGRMLMGIAR